MHDIDKTSYDVHTIGYTTNSKWKSVLNEVKYLLLFEKNTIHLCLVKGKHICILGQWWPSGLLRNSLPSQH